MVLCAKAVPPPAQLVDYPVFVEDDVDDDDQPADDDALELIRQKRQWGHYGGWRYPSYGFG